jgi:hypothetical protein
MLALNEPFMKKFHVVELNSVPGVGGQIWVNQMSIPFALFSAGDWQPEGSRTNIGMKKPNPEPVKADGPRNGSADLLGPNSEIGRKLKQYYDDLVSEEIPDRFAQLLRQLEQTEPAQKKG